MIHKNPVPHATPPLGITLDHWLDRLDTEGFQVGMRERLIVQDFLTRLAARGELPRGDTPEAHAAVLKLIAPLICTTPESQRHYGDLLKTFLATRPGRRKRRFVRKSKHIDEAIPPPIWRKWAIAAVLLLALLAGAGWLYLYDHRPGKVQEPESGIQRGPVVPLIPPPAQDIYTPPAPVAKAALPAQDSMRPLALAGWLVAGLSALLLALAAWTRLRRTLYLQGTRTDEQIEEHVLTDPHAGRIEPRTGPVRIASRGLRQRIAGEREVLDLDATLAATIQAAGAFSPRYRLLQHTPEYLALIDRRHPGDHLADYAEALVKALAEHGVTVQVYSFEGTPDHGCWRLRQGAGGREAFDRSGMAELAARYGGHRLLVFAEADALVDPLTGADRPWARQLGVFRQRAWFTPMPLPSWGATEEAADARGFLVLPMPAEALTTLAGWFSSGDLSLAAGADWPLAYPPLLKDQAVAWVARQSAPPEDTLKELLYQLRAYLGGPRHQWLCACAIFPSLSPTLTLALGKALGQEGEPDTRDLALGMATLGALPWFRHGRMPAWLRQSLLAQLTPDNEGRFREVVQQRLAGALEGEVLPGGAELARVATRRRLWAWLGRGSGPARDVVLVDFLRKDGLSRLAQALPEPLRRRLFRNGLIAQGLRPALLAGLAGLFALSLGLSLYLGFKEPVPPVIPPDRPIPIELIGCAGSGGVDADTRALADALAKLEPARLGLAGTATRIATTAYTPEAWNARYSLPAPAPGEIRVAAANAELAGGLREWLQTWKSASTPGTWALRTVQGGQAVPVANVCAGQAKAPPVDTTPAETINVYIQIGAESQRIWADQIESRLRRIPLVTVYVELVDPKRLPDRIEVRSRDGGNPAFIKQIENELSGNLGTPAVAKALNLLRGDTLKGNRYEIWASNRLCIVDIAPACGAEVAKPAAKPVTIREFQSMRRVIDPGQQDELCYAVDNAVRLTLAPNPGALRNTAKGCVTVAPTITTTYTLMALGKDGTSARRIFTVQVREAARNTQVPALTGRPVNQALEILAKLGLKAEQVAMTGPTRALPGTVLEQKPAPGSNVAPGSVVTLGVVSAPAPETGWCCILGSASQRQQGGVFSLEKKECASRGGLFYKDEGQAISECASFAGLGQSNQAPDNRPPSGWERVDVSDIQALLAKAGYYKGPVDGLVRDELVKALMLFQESRRLPADGIPGARTLSLLRGEQAAPSAPTQLRMN